MKVQKLVVLLVFMLFYSLGKAQPRGEYDIRLVEDSIDCTLMKYYVDIEIKATSGTTFFFVANQSYRFSYDETVLANPQIAQELEISGTTPQGWPLPDIVYAPHNLNGSTVGMVSYNVILSSGNGLPVLLDYVKVGRVSFDIVDMDKDFGLTLHSLASQLQPALAIDEIYGGGIYTVEEGSTNDLQSDVGIDVHVFLEGVLDPATGLMHTKLNELGLLPGQTPTNSLVVATPAGQPYSGTPWNHATSMNITTYAPTVVDWVLLSLRTDRFAGDVVYKTLGLLHKDGHVEMLEEIDFDTIPNVPLYISIQTRTHMKVMSHVPVERNCHSFSYDFRYQNSWNSSGSSFGQKQVGTTYYVMYGGDVDKSVGGDIGGFDSILLSQQEGYFGFYHAADMNLDGDINALEQALWSSNSGIGVPIFD